MTNVATTTTSVNMRSGPDKGNSVLKVLGKGTSVQVSDQYQNGYRYVSHQGTTGWIYADYLASGNGPEPGFATVTVDLNLRAEPSTNAKVIVVMPAGSQVSAGDQFSNGFRMVTYGNRTGWAYEAYLA